MITFLKVLLSALGGLIVILCVLWLLIYMAIGANAHDHTRPALNDWFSGLHNDKGWSCCDGTDLDTGHARHVEPQDWDLHDGHYRVRLNGVWVDVPDKAVIHGANLYGSALVWPAQGGLAGVDGSPIRCFLPGSET